MDVTSKLRIAKAKQKELARILDCPETQLSAELESYASAALREYVDMFIGNKVFRRGSDMLEYRLYLLVEEAYGNQIPNEQDVSRLFGTTATESRSLIRSVMSKYQYQLKAAIERSLKALVKAAKQEEEDGPHVVVINSQNLVDELNRTLADIDGNLPRVTKQHGSVSTYEISPSSYARLVSRLGI